MPPKRLWLDFLLYPTHTLPTAAAPVIVGTALAIHDHVFALAPVVIGFFASWLVHVGGVLMDNYRLLTDHASVREHPELSDAITSGSLSLSALWYVTVACFVLAAISGSYLMTVAGVAVPILGCVGTIASLGYSVSSLSLTRLGIADVVFFLMFGVVAVVGIYYVQAIAVHGLPAGRWIVADLVPLPAFVLGLPVGAIITNVLLIDDMRDREFDARKHWRTRPVVLGLNATRREFAGLMACAYVMPFWLWRGLGFSAWVLLPLITLPLATTITRVVCTEVRVASLAPMTPRTAALGLLYAVLLSIGVVLSR